MIFDISSCAAHGKASKQLILPERYCRIISMSNVFSPAFCRKMNCV